MQQFAVAYIYEEFPKYDRVERSNDYLKYFFKGVEVYSEVAPHWAAPKNPRLDMTFIEAKDSTDAYHKLIDTFPKHILTTVIQAVPKN